MVGRAVLFIDYDGVDLSQRLITMQFFLQNEPFFIFSSKHFQKKAYHHYQGIKLPY